MTNPYILLAALLAWIGTVIGAALWYGDVRETAVRAENLQHQNAALVAANATIERLNREARETESAHGAALAKIGADHETEKERLDALRRRDVDAARAGALRLRDPGARPAACPGAAPEVATAPGVGDGPAPGELSREAAAFLYELADDADAVASQLAACQAVITSDRTPKGQP